MSESRTIVAGSSTTSLLCICFVVLKLTGHIAWSWLWVLSPLWLPITVVMCVCLVIIIIAFIYGTITDLLDKWED